MSAVHKLKRFVPRGLHPRLGAVRRWLRAQPARTRRQHAQLLQDPALDPRQRELLARASSLIHYDDGMYKGDGAHYFKVGLSALGVIDEALAAAGKEDATVRHVLDLPCGYGRVLRLLVRRFPAATFTACELQRGAVEFCVREFGAQPAHSVIDLDRLTLDTRFDLIWCGSLITHLTAERTAALLRFFRRHLAADGLALFTAHGDRVIRWLQHAEFDYGIDPAAIPRIIAAYEQTGFGYTDYPTEPGYGIALTAPAWLRARAQAVGGLREVYFRPHGWDEHQDVYGFVRED